MKDFTTRFGKFKKSLQIRSAFSLHELEKNSIIFLLITLLNIRRVYEEDNRLFG